MIWRLKIAHEILEEGREEYLKKVFEQISEEKNFTMYSVDIKETYVHLIVGAHPKIAPSYIVKMLKGIGARKFLLKYPELKNKEIWDKHFYIETIGSANKEVLTNYVTNGKEDAIINEKLSNNRACNKSIS